MERVIVALGGNAIQKKGENRAEQQQSAVRSAVKNLMPLVTGDYEVVITHGNGPQVGHLFLQGLVADSEKTPAFPLGVCGSQSQGMIGAWIQLEFERAFREHGIDKTAASVVTLTEVDANDPAFTHPTKPVGPFYTEDEIDEVRKANPDFVYKEDSGRGYRRVVPSPKPKKIIEFDAIEKLVESGVIAISTGGGGIPAVSDEDGLKIVDAVIDKDLGASLLAGKLKADQLIILTSVENVYVNFNTPEEKALEKVTVDELKEYIDQKQFAEGSMLPKIQACLEFLERNPEGTASISSLEKVEEVLKQEAGTHIRTDW